MIAAHSSDRTWKIALSGICNNKLSLHYASYLKQHISKRILEVSRLIHVYIIYFSHSIEFLLFSSDSFKRHLSKWEHTFREPCHRANKVVFVSDGNNSEGQLMECTVPCCWGQQMRAHWHVLKPMLASLRPGKDEIVLLMLQTSKIEGTFKSYYLLSNTSTASSLGMSCSFQFSILL